MHKIRSTGGGLAAVAVAVLSLACASAALAQLQEANLNDYNQWKLALESGGVASPVSISTLPGYHVDIVRTALPGEGSWIALAFDLQGRIVVSREVKGLIRVTLDYEGKA